MKGEVVQWMKSENPIINEMFSKKKTKHGMDLRKSEGIEVKFAKTNFKRKMKFHGVKNIEKKIREAFELKNVTKSGKSPH